MMQLLYILALQNMQPTSSSLADGSPVSDSSWSSNALIISICSLGVNGRLGGRSEDISGNTSWPFIPLAALGKKTRHTENWQTILWLQLPSLKRELYAYWMNQDEFPSHKHIYTHVLCSCVGRKQSLTVFKTWWNEIKINKKFLYIPFISFNESQLLKNKQFIWILSSVMLFVGWVNWDF